MTRYADDIAAVLEMIQENGAPMTLTRPARVYDPRTGTFDDIAATETADGFAVRATESDTPILRVGALSGGTRHDTGTAEKREQANFLIPALGLAFAPEPDQVMQFASEAWDILAVETIAPDGTPILYIANGAK